MNDSHTFVGKVVCLLRCRRLWDNLDLRTGDILLERLAARDGQE